MSRRQSSSRHRSSSPLTHSLLDADGNGSNSQPEISVDSDDSYSFHDSLPPRHPPSSSSISTHSISAISMGPPSTANASMVSLQDEHEEEETRAQSISIRERVRAQGVSMEESRVRRSRRHPVANPLRSSPSPSPSSGSSPWVTHMPLVPLSGTSWESTIEYEKRGATTMHRAPSLSPSSFSSSSSPSSSSCCSYRSCVNRLCRQRQHPMAAWIALSVGFLIGAAGGVSIGYFVLPTPTTLLPPSVSFLQPYLIGLNTSPPGCPIVYLSHPSGTAQQRSFLSRALAEFVEREIYPLYTAQVTSLFNDESAFANFSMIAGVSYIPDPVSPEFPVQGLQTTGPPVPTADDLCSALQSKITPTVNPPFELSYIFGSKWDSGIEAEDAVFSVGVLTRAFTSLLAFQMMERGEIGFEESIGGLLGSSSLPTDPFSVPSFTGTVGMQGIRFSNITVGDLLSDTSGLPRRILSENASIALDLLSYLHLQFPLSSSPSQSDLGFALLGRVLVAAACRSLSLSSGQHCTVTFEDLLFDRILSPLGTNCSFFFSWSMNTSSIWKNMRKQLVFPPSEYAFGNPAYGLYMCSKDVFRLVRLLSRGSSRGPDMSSAANCGIASSATIRRALKSVSPLGTGQSKSQFDSATNSINIFCGGPFAAVGYGWMFIYSSEVWIRTLNGQLSQTSASLLFSPDLNIGSFALASVPIDISPFSTVLFATFQEFIKDGILDPNQNVIAIPAGYPASGFTGIYFHSSLSPYPFTICAFELAGQTEPVFSLSLYAPTIGAIYTLIWDPVPSSLQNPDRITFRTLDPSSSCLDSYFRQSGFFVQFVMDLSVSPPVATHIVIESLTGSTFPVPKTSTSPLCRPPVS